MYKSLAIACPALVLVGALATPAQAALPVDVPAAFGVLRTSANVMVVSTRVKSHSPSSTVTRVMVHRGGKQLFNATQKGVVVNRSLTGVKPGDFITVTAVDSHGHSDREARRVVVGPMK
jgi:hypothetical protein